MVEDVASSGRDRYQRVFVAVVDLAVADDGVVVDPKALCKGVEILEFGMFGIVLHKNKDAACLHPFLNGVAAGIVHVVGFRVQQRDVGGGHHVDGDILQVVCAGGVGQIFGAHPVLLEHPPPGGIAAIGVVRELVVKKLFMTIGGFALLRVEPAVDEYGFAHATGG